MLEAICNKGPSVVIRNVPIPKPSSPDHLIIKVVVSGSNPKDWKIAQMLEGHNQGDDIAGYVHEVC
jgi:NADPH:quinone reductase